MRNELSFCSELINLGRGLVLYRDSRQERHRRRYYRGFDFSRVTLLLLFYEFICVPVSGARGMSRCQYGSAGGPPRVE